MKIWCMINKKMPYSAIFYTMMISVSLTSEPRNPEIAICQTLDAPDLVEAYEKGQLKGKLKEIAANLDEESNPVVMLLKKKK